MLRIFLLFFLLTYSYNNYSQAQFISNCSTCGNNQINKKSSKTEDNNKNKKSSETISVFTKKKIRNIKNQWTNITHLDDYNICLYATISDVKRGIILWHSIDFYQKYVKEAKTRGLDCGVGNNKITSIASKPKTKTYTQPKSTIDNFYSKNAFLNSLKIKSDKNICLVAKLKQNTKGIFLYKKEAKRRGLDCGVGSSQNIIIASKPKTKTYTQPKSTITSAELDAANKRTNELERKLASLQSKKKQEQQRINTDNQIPTISAFTKQNGSNATISGRVTDNTQVAEVLIDGEQLSLTNNGTFKTELYIPRNGLNVEIVAYDRKGNKASKLLKIERDNIQQASGPIFDTLNPSGKTVKSNPNALALIIGVADYEKTNADALYADKDAQQFYDYATMKLGIKSSNIKELINDKADLGEILINVKDWLRRSAKPNKSDIYIYFAGHGLASDDGTKMYLLPYDGRPRLLENTAVLRDKLFADLSDINPRSVTVFLDTCYSGTTRGTDMLIASRPIAIRALKQSIPNNFTVFSAAASDQTSKPLEEAKHGMFSYFLMKGMEGDADTNSDNKITAQELHNYVKENVTQQSSGSQTPELQGDKDRVLVQFD